MKICSFLVALSLTVVLANALSTQEHVKRFFRPEHRMYLPDTSTLQLEDESSVPQNDDSTKCLPVCEPSCKKLNVPEYLTKNESFHRFEDKPINCMLATRVVFEKDPPYKCKWLSLYLFDCCRACNAKHAKCLEELERLPGGPEFCYRRANYKCMCKCLGKHNPLEGKKVLEKLPSPV